MPEENITSAALGTDGTGASTGGGAGSASAENKQRPTFGLPAGSVRAILALCVAFAVYWLLTHPSMLAASAYKLPVDLMMAFTLVVGYYFADRATGHSSDKSGQRPPLGLPTGTVRTLLVLGFIGAVAYLIHRFGAELPNQEIFPVIVGVGAFLFGRLGKMLFDYLWRSGKEQAFNIIGDIKGVICIAAGAGTVILFCFPTLGIPEEATTWFRDAFPAIITFYFGSR